MPNCIDNSTRLNYNQPLGSRETLRQGRLENYTNTNWQNRVVIVRIYQWKLKGETDDER
jgi:hypothetical protein